MVIFKKWIKPLNGGLALSLVMLQLHVFIFLPSFLYRVVSLKWLLFIFLGDFPPFPFSSFQYYYFLMSNHEVRRWF